jgi:acyl-homoserine-lactone acylase
MDLPFLTARRTIVLLLLSAGTGCARPATFRPAAPAELAAIGARAEIRRTEHGVPHILAPDLEAAAFALAWVQLEDHGARIIEGINAARGRAALVDGPERMDADAAARLDHRRARELFSTLSSEARQVYSGFAAGMNQYIRLHGAELPGWMRPDFTATDVLARDMVSPNAALMNRFRERVIAGDATVVEADEGDAAQNVGSNAWALAPERTTSGHAILLRNPHLAWTAGYYEAHVRVPGVLDFYGDFRIGGPFTVIGGFNEHLGFATTNNASRSHEIYALELDRDRPGRYLFAGRSLVFDREAESVEYREGEQIRSAERAFLRSVIGPVFHVSDTHAYVLRAAAAGEHRAGEQWLAMMRARTLDEWKDAMRMGARTTSNFTYADRAGNIFYVWMSGAPVLPHAPGSDTVAILARDSGDVWIRRAPFDSLPQLHNPPGGYTHQENDSPHFTNLNAILPHAFSFPVEEPRLRLRSQHAVLLLHNDRKFSLEDVVAAKHSMRMLLADRVKDDLLAALRARDAHTAPEIGAAMALLASWDNTAAADARGAVLFETWWSLYRRALEGAEPHAVPWSSDDPMATPRGLADEETAARAFLEAVSETAQRFGSWDVAWGAVHRVRRGDVDVPVGGCGGALGCFRVLNFETAEDGRRVVNGGDGWVIAIEFGPTPRAFSILAYGQSPDATSPWHADQARPFAENRMKTVRFTEEDIARNTVVRYRPGQGAR